MLEKHLKFELNSGSEARDGWYTAGSEMWRIEIMEEGYRASYFYSFSRWPY